MTSQYSYYLAIAGDWAAILTAIVAVYGYCKYIFERCARRKALEDYLETRKSEASKEGEKGQHTIISLLLCRSRHFAPASTKIFFMAASFGVTASGVLPVTLA